MSQIISGANALIPADYAAVGVGGVAVVANQAATALDIANFVFMGITLGGWVQILGVVTAIAVCAYTVIRAGKAIYNLFKGNKIDS